MKIFKSNLGFIPKRELYKRRPAKKRERINLAKRMTALFLAACMFLSGCKREVLQPENLLLNESNKQVGNAETASGDDFTIVVIPDTQYYTSSLNGGLPAMMTSQMNWIKNNRVAENIVYVAGVGDIVEYGDTNNSEWVNGATNGWYLLESVSGLPGGIPYGVAVGNHDQSPYAKRGFPLTSSTAKFNQYFGRNHFASKFYYGENRSNGVDNNNDCHYDLFSAGGVDFIVIYLEFDNQNEDWDAAGEWAKNMLTIYSHRKGIIVTHDLMNAGIGTSFNPQGAHLYGQKIKYRTNCFMMLSGHTGPQGRRADTYNGNTINTVMQDYQSNNPSGTGANAKGGNGWLRLFKFSVANNSISVKTYSPYINQWATNSNNEFTLQMFSTPYTQPTVLNPIEDAYVRDGSSYENNNYGLDNGFVIKDGAIGFRRKALLKFNLNSVPSFSRAVLKVYGSNTESSANTSIRVYKTYSTNNTEDSWTETGVTWNNCPVAHQLGIMNVNNAVGYYEWDVTDFIQAEAAGDKTASIVLAQTAGQNLTTTWQSREGANKPQLVLYQ